MGAIIQDPSRFLDMVLTSTQDAIIIVDDQLHVNYMNDSAKRILNIEEHEYKERHFYNDLNLFEIANGHLVPILQELMDEGISQKGIVRRTRNGKMLNITAVPVIEDGIKKGILITGQDITSFVEMEQELDMAFALTLPNSKVEYKLKSLVEYKDKYDPHTKNITITGIIEDGGYRHVVNCLKLFSTLHGQGITKIIGIDKDKLVQAFIFHDLGKSQPRLSIGDVVDPKNAFEDGKLHAFRSAEIAKNFYHQDDVVVEISRYHHHHEKELPDTFPWRLLPLFRLFQLIDGLSAAITRGGVMVKFSVNDCVIQVTEENHRPQYNGTWEIDLYTGERRRIL
jgi:PAS domain S-box-containing protein